MYTREAKKACTEESKGKERQPTTPLKYACSKGIKFLIIRDFTFYYLWLQWRYLIMVAHRKVHNNSLIQLRRPYKFFNPQWCILCKEKGESINHLFLHRPFTIGLWNNIFSLASLVWVPPRRLEDFLIITFRGFGNSIRGKTLWKIVNLFVKVCSEREKCKNLWE